MDRGQSTNEQDDGENDRFESVPPSVIQQAKNAFRNRRAGELAVLTFDSLVTGDDPPESHRLRFEHPAMAFELEVAARGRNTMIQGRVLPPGDASRVAIHLEGTDLALVESLTEGCFGLGPVGHGLVRLSVERGEAATVFTDWFRI